MILARKKTLIIAEAGVNHDGDEDKALALIDAAVRAGADAVKFQAFEPEAVASKRASLAAYQARNMGEAESQTKMLKRLALSPEAFLGLAERCAVRGIEFLATPFDLPSLTLLTEKLTVKRLKIGSGDLTNAPLLVQAGRTGRPIILSTGMATLAETEEALGALAFGYLGAPGFASLRRAQPGEARLRSAELRAAERAKPAEVPKDRAELAETLRTDQAWAVLRERVTLLHCTSDYPAAAEDANLKAMDSLKAAFGLDVGYSDHTLGTVIAVAAAARGAAVIEKHLTLDRKASGPDHKASLEPEEFAAMVRAIRDVERALGDGLKRPALSELGTLAVARKSLVAARPIAKGERFTADNIAVKRPGDGLSPFSYWDTLGRAAQRAFDTDDLIEP